MLPVSGFRSPRSRRAQSSPITFTLTCIHHHTDGCRFSLSRVQPHTTSSTHTIALRHSLTHSLTFGGRCNLGRCPSRLPTDSAPPPSLRLLRRARCLLRTLRIGESGGTWGICRPPRCSERWLDHGGGCAVCVCLCRAIRVKLEKSIVLEIGLDFGLTDLTSSENGAFLASRITKGSNVYNTSCGCRLPR